MVPSLLSFIHYLHLSKTSQDAFPRVSTFSLTSQKDQQIQKIKTKNICLSHRAAGCNADDEPTRLVCITTLLYYLNSSVITLSMDGSAARNRGSHKNNLISVLIRRKVPFPGWYGRMWHLRLCEDMIRWQFLLPEGCNWNTKLCREGKIKDGCKVLFRPFSFSLVFSCVCRILFPEGSCRFWDKKEFICRRGTKIMTFLKLNDQIKNCDSNEFNDI